MHSYEVVLNAGRSQASEFFILFAVKNQNIQWNHQIIGVSRGNLTAESMVRLHLFAGFHNILRIFTTVIPWLK